MAIDLMFILQHGTLGESVFLLVGGFALFALYHSLYPPGHALNNISTYLLMYSFPFHQHPPPMFMYTSRRVLFALSCWSRCSDRFSIGPRSGDRAGHLKTLFEPFGIHLGESLDLLSC